MHGRGDLEAQPDPGRDQAKTLRARRCIKMSARDTALQVGAQAVENRVAVSLFERAPGRASPRDGRTRLGRRSRGRNAFGLAMARTHAWRAATAAPGGSGRARRQAFAQTARKTSSHGRRPLPRPAARGRSGFSRCGLSARNGLCIGPAWLDWGLKFVCLRGASQAHDAVSSAC